MANPLAGMKLLDWIMAGLGVKDLLGLGGGGGSFQDRATFEDEQWGDVNLDPGGLLARGIQQGTEAYDVAAQRANTPVQLRSSFVQQPPTFAGGGLPMPIGVSGYDPALGDPSLQTSPGRGGQEASEEALAAIDLLKGSQWKPGK